MMNMTGQLKAQLREAINNSNSPWALTLDGQKLTIESGGVGMEFGFDLNDDGDPMTQPEMQTVVDALQVVVDAHNSAL